ncbi:E3 ubiquitin-protein ligase RNF169 isoform X3 [Paroedura picta]|uniref:E3 ubiquitin-protein ligase RNF169 isoform X3 n=1 Tax=Paroedura picta TaxID=143630 RepID=UPI0040564C89
MAAAATAGALGVRAAVSPLLRRGRGRRRRAREETEAGAGPPRQQPASGEEPADRGAALHFIFRAPITLSKAGELHEEYRSQLRKLRDEKWQEERPPEEFIHKLIFEEAEAGRRRAEDQKKEEPSAVKMTQEHLPERLSDSENEEPFQGKSGHHRSAFVSKGSSYSLALLAGNLGSRVERSQSCNDTLRERSKSRQRSAPVRTKVNPLLSVSAPVAGVLSSTQNNRCLSAPDLTAEKRAALTAAASLPLPPKPERSVSPESNDSISEELNHFKPIVCSPCTPPKRLPDGRVLSPRLIKSTPRNLTRSLQKPTTYEASPRILRKWEQIFQERQAKKTLSKATLTATAPDPGEECPVAATNIPDVLIEEPLQASKDFLASGSPVHAHARSEGFPSLCQAKLESSLPSQSPRRLRSHLGLTPSRLRRWRQRQSGSAEGGPSSSGVSGERRPRPPRPAGRKNEEAAAAQVPERVREEQPPQRGLPQRGAPLPAAGAQEAVQDQALGAGPRRQKTEAGGAGSGRALPEKPGGAEAAGGRRPPVGPAAPVGL